MNRLHAFCIRIYILACPFCTSETCPGWCMKESLGLRKPSAESYRRFIAQIRKNPIANASDYPDPVDLIREDRDR